MCRRDRRARFSGFEAEAGERGDRVAEWPWSRCNRKARASRDTAQGSRLVFEFVGDVLGKLRPDAVGARDHCAVAGGERALQVADFQRRQDRERDLGTDALDAGQQAEPVAFLGPREAQEAQEILADFPDGLDAIITGVGTGGHITACAKVLKPKMPGLKVYAVEPTLSPVLSGGQPGPHPIQGIGAGFVPGVMDTAVIDGVIQVAPDDAKEMARRSAREEGTLIGISSGATLAAIRQHLEKNPTHRVLGFNYDTGERYLSVPDFLPE